MKHFNKQNAFQKPQASTRHKLVSFTLHREQATASKAGTHVSTTIDFL
jgi:hypothetical protein